MPKRLVKVNISLPRDFLDEDLIETFFRRALASYGSHLYRDDPLRLMRHELIVEKVALNTPLNQGDSE